MSTFPSSRPLTVADLDRMPDDGHRYELIDGTLIVTPAPDTRHQMVSANLFTILRAGCPAELVVLTAPYDVLLDDRTLVEPDLVVARRADLAPANLPVPPVLAVEILSPSTEAIDLGSKMHRYAKAGFEHYWVVDPRVPSLRVLELDDGTFEQVVEVVGDEAWTASTPYAVTIVPDRLLD